MSTSCVAFAYATELSLATFSATAAFTGAAMFALMSDMAARSGSASPARASRSSRVSVLYSCGSFAISASWSGGRCRRLADVAALRSVRGRDRVVGQDVGGHGRVDRDRDVGVDQRHRGPLRQL